MYKDDCKKKLKNPVCFLTFARLQPKDVFKIGKMPYQQCIYDWCENFHLDRQAFQGNEIKGILNHTDECIKQSWCDIADLESNTDSNANLEEDGLHQVNPAYFNFSCIT